MTFTVVPWFTKRYRGWLPVPVPPAVRKPLPKAEPMLLPVKLPETTSAPEVRFRMSALSEKVSDWPFALAESEMPLAR